MKFFITVLSLLFAAIACVIANPLAEDSIGTTNVRLEHEICRKQECNLGNLVADAFRYSYWIEHATSAAKGPIVLVLGNELKATVEAGGEITEATLKDILPSAEKLYFRSLKGSVIKTVLEHSVRK